MGNSAHRTSEGFEAAQLANDAERRVRGGESAREALQHEAHSLRKLDTHNGHFNTAHYRHEMYLVHSKLHQKLEHDGLLPKMHVAPDGREGDQRRHHPFHLHKDKPLRRSLAPHSTADLSEPSSQVERKPPPPEPLRISRPNPDALSGIQPQPHGSDVLPPKRSERSDIPLAAPGPAPKIETSTTPGTPGEIDGWLGIHNQLKAKANSTAPALAFYGDSITEGMHLNNFFAQGFGGKAENFGIHSDTTDNLRYRLEDGEMKFKNGEQPKDVVMLIGTNDIGKKTSEQIAHDIIADAELAAKNLPHSKVLLLGLLPRAGHMTDVQDINRQLDAYMKGPHSPNLRYADVGSKMLTNGQMVYGPALTKNESQIWQPGGLHPTYGPGYSRLFNSIDRALRVSDSAETV